MRATLQQLSRMNTENLFFYRSDLEYYSVENIHDFFQNQFNMRIRNFISMFGRNFTAWPKIATVLHRRMPEAMRGMDISVEPIQSQPQEDKHKVALKDI